MSKKFGEALGLVVLAGGAAVFVALVIRLVAEILPG